MENTSSILDKIKQLEAQLTEVEMAMVRGDKTNTQLMIQLEAAYDEIREKITEAYEEYGIATRDPTLTEPTITIPDGVHFFRYGKIDRLEQSKGTPWHGLFYSLEYSLWGGVQECYNELPEDVRLSAADLVAWGEQHTSNMQLPTVEELQEYFELEMRPQIHLLCCALVTEYLKHFGDRFVVKITRANESK